MEERVTESIPFSSRVVLAWVAFFRILFDGVFARHVEELRSGQSEPALDTSEVGRGGRKPPPEPARTTAESEPPPPREAAPKLDASKLRQEGALLFLSVLQQDGRLIDFLRQDVTSFDDAEVGAAARVVHEGCRKAVDAHVTLAAVRSEAEGATVTVGQDETAALVKLTGNVRGSAPFEGKLLHKGWRATKVTLPTPTKGHEMTVLCPAEVEL